MDEDALPEAQPNDEAVEEKTSLVLTGEGIKWEPIKALDLSEFVKEVAMKVENEPTSTATTTTEPEKKSESKSPSEDNAKPSLKKKQTKKEKLQSRHSKLMSRKDLLSFILGNKKDSC